MKPDAGPGSRGREEDPQESSRGEAENLARRCFLCGESLPDAAESCPACGESQARAAREGSQPAFERVPGTAAGSSGVRRLLRSAIESLAAAGQTVTAISLNPDKAFRSFRYRGGLLAPTVFSILVGGPCIVLSSVSAVLIRGGGEMPTGVWALAACFLAPPLYVYIRAQLLHLTLVLSGRAREPFAATFRITGYSNASVAPLLVVPYVGDAIFLLAGAVVEATGLRHGHRLKLAEAAMVELAPAAALFIGMLAAVTLGFLWWSQAAG